MHRSRLSAIGIDCQDGDLEAGEWRPLQPDEVRALYKAIDMPVP